MNNLMKPIIKRTDEWKKRPEAVNKTYTAIAGYYKKLETLHKKMPWVTKEQKEPVYKLINETVTWMQNMIE